MSFRNSTANLANILKIEVIAGRKLKTVDDSKPCPYVLLKYNNKTKSTEVISDTCNPKWRIGSLSEEFSFRVNPAEKIVSLVVMDWQGESGVDRVIGTIDVDVQAVIEMGDKVIEDWVDIEPPAFSLGNALMKLATLNTKKETSVGQLYLRIWVEKKKVSVEKSPLWEAVQAKLVDDVKTILKGISFKEITATNSAGDTILHIAVARKDWDSAAAQILLLLLEDERIDVNAVNKDQNTAFHYFCQRYTGPHPFGPFDRFIERGADVHAKNKYGETPLHKAVFHPSLKLTLIDLLIQRGADIHETTVTGETPLHYAVHLGREDVVRFLLQKGADPLVEANDGSTPLSIAKAEHPVIASRITDTLELLKWLKRNDLMMFSEEFIANDLFLYIIPEITEEYLERMLPDDCERAKVLRAVNRFRRETGTFRVSADEMEKKEQFQKQKLQLKLTDQLRQSLDAAALQNVAQNTTAQSSTEQQSEQVVSNANETRLYQPTLRDSLVVYRSKKNTLRRIVVSKEKKNRIVAAKDKNTNQPGVLESPSAAANVQPPASPEPTNVAPASHSKESIKSSPRAKADSRSSGSGRSSLSPEPDGNHSWEIDIRDIEFIRSLGMGSSGEVLLGKYNGELVAVKVLNHKNIDNEIQEFKKEFKVLITIKSDYVVKFYGATVQSRLALVMEYCPKGSLFDVLRSPWIQLSWDEFFQMASDIANGLADLHGRKPEVLHRDLKTLNLLVTDNLRVKLCDFGLSRFNTGSNLATLSKQRGTFAYIAPEIYDCVPFSTKSDVYSIAIVYWEMIFRLINGYYQRPYKEYPFICMDFQTLIMARKKNLRPTLPEETPQSLKDLINSMWTQDPDKRPSAREVTEALTAIKHEYESNKKKWLKLLEKAFVTQLERQAAAAAEGNADATRIDTIARPRHTSASTTSYKTISITTQRSPRMRTIDSINSKAALSRNRESKSRESTPNKPKPESSPTETPTIIKMKSRSRRHSLAEKESSREKEKRSSIESVRFAEDEHSPRSPKEKPNRSTADDSNGNKCAVTDAETQREGTKPTRRTISLGQGDMSFFLSSAGALGSVLKGGDRG